MRHQRIGELLVARGLVTPADRDHALQASQSGGGRLASQLLALKLVDEGAVVEALASLLGFPGVDLSRSALDLANLDLIPREVAQFEQILPLKVAGGRLLLAIADPLNHRILEEVQLISGLTVLPHVALTARLEFVIQAAYAAQATGSRRWVGEALLKGHQAPVLALREGTSPAAVATVAAESDDIEIELEEPGEESDVELASVSARPGPRLILVVDDDEEILTLVARTLEKKGYRVERARRGQEALDRVSELFPDLVLLDANLPEIHGFDVCKKIKANPRFARMPVLMMTAVYRGWRFAQDSRESFGVDDYIEKPFRLDDLLRRIEHHLSLAIGEPQRDRERADRLYEEGLKSLEAGQVAQAVKTLEEAAEADGFSARIQSQLGRALQAAGDGYRAIGAYERSVELRPDHFPTLRSLAALYQQKGFRRKASEAWERAIPAAPDDVTREKIKRGLLSQL